MLILPNDILLLLSKYSYLLLTYIMLQGSLVIILVYLFLDRLGNTKKRKLDNELIKQEAYQQALKVLEDAKSSSLKIIQEAQENAGNVVKDYVAVNDDARKEIEGRIKTLGDMHVQNLTNISNSFIEEFKGVLRSQGAKGVEEIEKTSTIVTQGIQEELTSIQEVLRKESYEVEQEVSKKINEEYDRVRKELDVYTKDKYSKVNDEIFNIIVQTLKETTTKIIDVDTHQQLILEFLEEAKKQNKLDI